MTLNLAADAPLLQAFAKLPDPRKSRNQIYPLIDIIAVAIIGILCSANDWVNVVRWANAYENWFQSVGLCLNGVPSHDTIGRFFRLVDPKAFESCFVVWMQMITDKIQGVIAIDGKTICNSSDVFNEKKAVHIVTAFAAENDIILGQLKTAEKSNEITAIPELLDTLVLKGCTVTIDAMGCQKAIIKKIRDGRGEYVVGLKGNQGTLHAEAVNFFDQAIEVGAEEAGCEYYNTVEKGHGRIEEREVWMTSNLEWLEGRAEWEGLQSLICIRSTRHEKGKTTIEKRYYISSLRTTAQRVGEVIRLHWGIENKLHWHLDVTFNEDKSKICAGYGAENFSLLKRCVLNMVKADTTETGSVTTKRRIAGWNPAYRLRLLGVK
jgi:predicted transposase YbfD/YdcC